ncbi:hypothetical protein BY458DRAFT_510882 [Sporodiniella umbellata]|nr:hypothetical protein BY458DRAFT_510882 [Sporodiniella umbellata]
MPHSFPVTVVAATPTKVTIQPPPMDEQERERFSVAATPPLSSMSPVVELAPMMGEVCDGLGRKCKPTYMRRLERPPSPESPRYEPKTMIGVDRARPVEPMPQFDEPKTIFPFSLYKPLTPTFSCIPSLQIPTPRRRRSSPPLSPPPSASSTPYPMFPKPMSPTMAAASASAAVPDWKDMGLARHDPQKALAKQTAVDQSMFLTKNAHIKRPRNAWIHFRCHYGQALKRQDPTLRAEEISKRASLRWSKLSENEKKPWHALAEQEKLAHREAFPEYRYCPRRAAPTDASPSLKRSPKHSPLQDCHKRSKRNHTNQLL